MLKAILRPLALFGGLALLAGCGGGKADTAVAQGALTIVQAADVLQLYDPQLPRSGANPLTIETGTYGPGGAGLAYVYDVDATNGMVSRPRVPRAAYWKDGKIYVFNTERGADHTPRQVSSIADACSLQATFADLANVDLSWTLIEQAGPNQDCSTQDPDNVRSLVRLNAAATEAPLTIAAGTAFLSELHSHDGALQGFLVQEDGVLKKRDRNLANPVSIGPEPVEGCYTLSRYGFDWVYLACGIGGASSQVYSYRVDTAELTEIHDLGTSGAGWAEADASGLYLAEQRGDGLGEGRIVRAANTGGDARVLSTYVAGIFSDIVLTDQRVVFQISGDQFEPQYVYSVNKSATAAAPTLLYDAGGAFRSAIIKATSGGLVYVSASYHGLTEEQPSPVRKAAVVRQDGTDLQILPDMLWGRGEPADSFPFPYFTLPAAGLIRFSNGASGAVLEKVDPDTMQITPFAQIAGTQLRATTLIPSGGLDRYLRVTGLYAGSFSVRPMFVIDTQNGAFAEYLDATLSGGGGN